MTTHLPALLMVSGALLVAGCARQQESLPPPPPQAAPAPAPAIDAPGTVPPPADVGTTGLDGLQGEFARAAGSDTILFGFDSYALDEAARQTLGAQAGWLGGRSTVRVTIEGHADERGTREYNLALGERRANAAATFLAAQGVSSSRINVISYGKERPAVDGSNEEAWARNRRAVTVVSGQ
jgi:peptidoglycan-associated lipoprotein